MIHHPGKVLKVFRAGRDVDSSDASTQALVEMWDENMFTCTAEQRVAARLKEGDVVLVDYRPVSAKVLVPKQTIAKILRGDTAKQTWSLYQSYHRKKKEEQTAPRSQERVQAYG